MKITRQRHRDGFTLIEMLIVLAITSMMIISVKISTPTNHPTTVDMMIFISMMQAVANNKIHDIKLNNVFYNSYHPNHAFARSYTQQFDTFEVVFHIGRGYYALQKRK